MFAAPLGCSIAPARWTNSPTLNNTHVNVELTKGDQFLLLELVLEHPGNYLHEVRYELQASGTEAGIIVIS